MDTLETKHVARKLLSDLLGLHLKNIRKMLLTDGGYF
jgi:hypothetical protein